ncbi:MAG: thiamine pyrophosphate-dependent dehydrogenase E1 component subunit alpha [Deltaproteobacteria bacterium]|nr:thiamine pyrophosphate-dependent dehydrogenase E1 component subunit alpha [Deltaproteobacteria bacterium]MBW2305843.1 thiamine pyrophosphate-dependent dehydrogenase E1 component subunit alpha [Deltaproteobacteria bacterium]
MLDNHTLIRLYRLMVLTRRTEEVLNDEFRAGSIPRSPHSGIGHEGFSVGAVAPLRQDDYLFGSHRGIGHSIAKGMAPSAIIAEAMGRVGGCGKGRAGSPVDTSLGVLGISGCQGGNHVIATGTALSASMRQTQQVTACFFGDATANRGTFLEGINMAAVWKLPVLFFCENNFWGFSTPILKAMAVENVADRAPSLGLPGVIVDGNDVIAVYEETSKAIERARKGEGPTLIEGKTYRWRGHHEKDPDFYRSAEDIEEWKEKCPIRRLKERMLKDELLKKTEFDAIDREIEKEVLAAVKWAKESPAPGTEELHFVHNYYL